MLKFPSPYDKVLPDEIKLDRTPHYHQKDDICKRIVGSLVGLAIGDALGASVEFRPQQYLAANPVRKMEGGGTWGLDAGKWTDDTSMALCLASSLIAENGFNPYDQMVRYKWWHKHGYLSSTGNCFDIGKATRQSIMDFSTRQKMLKIHYRCRSEYEVDTLTLDSVERINNFDVRCGDQNSAGNGALMRLAPIPLFYFKTPAIAIEYAGRSASLTHANQKAIDACRYYAALIIGALSGFKKDQLLAKNFYSEHKEWFGEEPLHDDIKLVAEGSYKKKGGYEDGIRGKGYVVNALEAALWAFWSDEDSFEKGALAAVNLGDDTDTTAAIHGQLAGAYYGYEKIPKDWLSKLYARDLIVCIGEWIHFQGLQRGSEDSEYQYILSTEIMKSEEQEQKQQQTVSASATSQSKVDEINDKSNKDMRLSKQKPNFDRSISLDSNTVTASNRVLSPNGVHPELTSFKSPKRNDRDDDFTRTTHDYAFYPSKSKFKDFP
jgi:ADP-ribosyl-[dinitrogen reductase] hydrolase